MSASADTPPVGTKRFEDLELALIVSLILLAVTSGLAGGAYLAWNRASSIYHSLVVTSVPKDGDVITGYEVDPQTNRPTWKRVALEAHVPYEGADPSSISYTLHTDDHP